MATFILVHGGSVSGRVWDGVAADLLAAGHAVRTPTLTDERWATLGEHVDEVTAILDGESRGDLILVGHSYGGLVASAAAARRSSRVHRLVLLDSFLPTDGLSLFDQLRRCGIDVDRFPGLDPFPAYVEPLSVDLAAILPLPKAYVHCLRSEFGAVWDITQPRLTAGAFGADVRIFEIDSRHNCMADRPAETAAVLLACAQDTSPDVQSENAISEGRGSEPT